ncbi:glutamate-5-semialdehyde dehydrogenase [Halosquirtibacter xylanolyticus]|uniref:glutamate-5-semialdehyde dehydrogenase n=1 Tax=Halosquirtibacter xylanolyticus TaxID=3374599 RepID=UPI00374A1747|nr:glutamate-5-semialdehyde dehydrogenase [Prolixibacteraceae bacterium]
MKLNNILHNTRKASKSLAFVEAEKINQVLNHLANLLEKHSGEILHANEKDTDRMESEDPKFDRLLLTKERISGIASDLRNVASLPSPLGKTLQSITRPNGMSIEKVRVPFGVIGVIYEARPNVTIDVFSLCLKSGNCCILKGGSDAYYSNEYLVTLIHKALSHYGLDPQFASLLSTDRSEVNELLHAVRYVDLIIPRGSQQLIEFVRTNATVPVIETGAGICHTYFDKYGDVEKGRNIITNAKTRRVSVCNALDCLILHHSRLDDLQELTSELAKLEVIIHADEESYNKLVSCYPSSLLQKATEKDFGTEYLSLQMSIKTVASLEEALDHIDQFSSRHSEAIVSDNVRNCEIFCRTVDAAAVYENVSTAFTDGAQFGLGAEIGISTQKLHARGPMALEEITSYKWIIKGDGQIRSN